MRKSLRYYLLKSGFVDEGLCLRQQEIELHDFEDYNMIDLLVKSHHANVAIGIARNSHPGRRADNLFEIAQQISSDNPGKTTELLKEADDDLKEFRNTPTSKNTNPKYKDQYADALSFSLAVGYKMIGKDNEAKGLMQEATKDATPLQAMFLRMQYALSPLLLKKRFYPETNISNDKLSEINIEFNAYLSQNYVNEEIFSSLQQLIKAQIAAGQLSDARSNIEIIEKFALKKMQSAKDQDDFNDAMSVAKLWKETNDNDRSYKILTAIFNAPVKVKDFAKIDRANLFIYSGFVDEGLKFIGSLPKDQRKPKTIFVRPIYYELTKAHPNLFPKKMLLQDKTALEQVQALTEFAKGLTWDVFHAPGEKELELYVGNGYGSGC